MTADFHIDDDNKLITINWHGEIIFADLVEEFTRYHREVRNQAEYARYDELLDFTGGAGLLLTLNNLKMMADSAVVLDQSDIKTRLAIIVRSWAAYFLAKTYVVIRGFNAKSSKEVSVFHEKSDALAWLNKQDNLPGNKLH